VEIRGCLTGGLFIVAIQALGWVGSAIAAEQSIKLELNKLEQLTTPPPGCRVYMVIANPDNSPIPQLRLDLAVFGSDGIIARRIALDLGPLPADKTAVRLFDLNALPCDSIGQILLNDVLSCQIGEQTQSATDQQRQSCLDRISVSSRAKVSLTK
jgi:hypothetical protein